MGSGLRFPLVNSLRALAALSVVAFHAVGYFAAGFSKDAALRPFLARLDVGVVIFLAISGFLLYRPYARAALHGEPPPDARGYAWRRFLRIVPAYWVALLVAALVLSLHGVFSAHGLLVYFGFGQIYRTGTIGGGIPPAWTLGLEVTFYAMLPLYASLVRRLRVELAGVLVLLLGSMAYKAALFATGVVAHPSLAPQPALVILPGYLDEFALGMALAVLSVRLEGRSLPRALALVERRPGIAWLAAAAAFAVASLGIGLTGDPSQRYSAAQYLAREALYGIVAVGLMLPAVFGHERRGGVRRFMALPVMVWLGAISYGIYLWHWPVLLELDKWGLASVTAVHPYLRWGGAALVLSVAIGALSYYLVERPALSLKRLVPAAARMRGEPIAP